jgi:hypothetical protein
MTKLHNLTVLYWVRNSADSGQEEREMISEISTWVDLVTSCTLLGEEQCGQ